MDIDGGIFVDQRFLHSCSKYPSSVANDVPIRVLKFNLEIPGHDSKLLFFIAFDNVLIEGENKVAW